MQIQHKDAGGQLWEQENLLQAERAGMAVPARREPAPALLSSGRGFLVSRGTETSTLLRSPSSWKISGYQLGDLCKFSIGLLPVITSI